MQACDAWHLALSTPHRSFYTDVDLPCPGPAIPLHTAPHASPPQPTSLHAILHLGLWPVADDCETLHCVAALCTPGRPAAPGPTPHTTALPGTIPPHGHAQPKSTRMPPLQPQCSHRSAPGPAALHRPSIHLPLLRYRLWCVAPHNHTTTGPTVPPIGTTQRHKLYALASLRTVEHYTYPILACLTFVRSVPLRFTQPYPACPHPVLLSPAPP